jgi:hypothetical protein
LAKWAACKVVTENPPQSVSDKVIKVAFDKMVCLFFYQFVVDVFDLNCSRLDVCGYVVNYEARQQQDIAIGCIWSQMLEHSWVKAWIVAFPAPRSATKTYKVEWPMCVLAPLHRYSGAPFG